MIAVGAMTSQTCQAFEVMVSLNTYRKAKVTDAVDRVDELYGDGVWFITKNTDFSNNELRDTYDLLGGRQVSEDNPNNTESYDKYLSIMGKKPTASFFYNETGGKPGGTLLSNAQINSKYAHTGNKKIICLTRAYLAGAWKNQTDRCLNNSKVEAIAIEPVRAVFFGFPNGLPRLINACKNKGKRLYIMLHAAPDGWSDADQHHILSELNKWGGAHFETDNIVLVYQNYDQHAGNHTNDWLGDSQSVKSAMRIAMAHPKYSGRGFNPPTTPPPSTAASTSLKEIYSDPVTPGET